MDSSKAEKEITTPPAKNQPKYSKEQALRSKLFERNRDVLAVILDEKKSYTKAEIQSTLKSFYERAVT